MVVKCSSIVVCCNVECILLEVLACLYCVIVFNHNRIYLLDNDGVFFNLFLFNSYYGKIRKFRIKFKKQCESSKIRDTRAYSG